MPRIEVEVDDKGEIVGQTPAELSALFKRTETAAHGQGYAKGMSEAAEAAKKQIADNVQAELAKRDAERPLEKEKYERIDSENKLLKTQLSETARDADRNLRAREEAHAKELVDRADTLKKRNARITDLVKKEIRSYALEAGAREESLPELEVILGNAIGFDDDMEPFVKGSDGKPVLVHGKPQPIATFVKEYVTSHPHHRKPPQGQGGGARGGASFHGQHGQTATVDQARDRIEKGDRSSGAINNLFEATRNKRQAS